LQSGLCFYKKKCREGKERERKAERIQKGSSWTDRNLEGVKVKRDVVTLPDAGPEVKCGCRVLTSDKVQQEMMQDPDDSTVWQMVSQGGIKRGVGALQELCNR
jgi:hypothetical protein